MKKRDIRIIVLLVIIIVVILTITIIQKNIEPKENINKGENIIKEENIIINDIKEEKNLIGDTEIYDVKSEYDGRKIIQIKPDVQFETVLAGIIKNSIFTEEEIQILLKDRPQYNGIWISKDSREKFLNLLKENNINNYDIDDNGYLKLESNNGKEENKIIEDAIKSDNLYIIDISGTSYIRDEISGEIVEYPFEKMAPYQILDTYNNDNATILEVTTNEKNKISNKDILNEILQNIK